MNSHKSGDLIDEARLLMPWYLTNNLSSEEQKLVDEALEQSPELRGEFLQEEKMMRLLKENKSLLELTAPNTTEQRLDQVLSRIQSAEQPVVQNASSSSEKEKSENGLSRFFKSGLLGTDWLSPANAVFAGLLVCQLGVLGYMQMSPSSEEAASERVIYKTASVPETQTGTAGIKQSTAVFLMEFHSDASYGEMCDFLNAQNARIVSGPDSRDMFSVAISTGSPTDLAALADSIMQQAVDNNVPLAFIGPRFQK